MAWTVRDVPQPEGNTPEEAVAIARDRKIARALGTLVFCDVSDAVGTGTPGESTWILKALVEHGSGLTSYMTLRDGEAARQAWEHNAGEEITLTVGGKIDTVYNAPFTFTGLVDMKQETSYGKTVILKHEEHTPDPFPNCRWHQEHRRISGSLAYQYGRRILWLSKTSSRSGITTFSTTGRRSM
ncbi:MAG: MlrC C-terminal domain-containing protein [Bacteroidales bacterium]|nr:MlrC C-terminal domain-containing protein [Bacteroidales bacterium]